MGNRNVIITGANSGIGKAAAVKFASEGYHVIMACRDLIKSKKALHEVVRISKNEFVELMEVDVSSFGSIRKFCSEFKQNHQKLDILIHNAGHFNHGMKTYQLSADKIELTFATNTFGPFLMTELLLDYLEKSDGPRVLSANTTNIKHFFNPKREIEFGNLQGEYKTSRPYNAYKMYGDSKMGLLLLTYKMAEKYKPSGVKVNSLMVPAVKVSEATLKRLNLYYGPWAA
ncbi:MAG: SDR family NAD(P)-dependent oxidoreductase [Balneolales bacterium]